MTYLPKHVRNCILVYGVTAVVVALEGVLAAVTVLRPFLTGERSLQEEGAIFDFLPGIGLGLGFIGFLAVPVIITALGLRRQQSWARVGGIVISFTFIGLIGFTLLNGETRFGAGLLLHGYVLWALLLHAETRSALTRGPLA